MLWWNKLSHCFVQNKKLHLSFFVDPKSLILELILDPIPFFWRTIMYAIIKHLIETAYLYHNLCTYKNVPEKRHWCSSELWWCIIKTQKRVDDTFSFVTLYGWTNTMKTFHYQLLRKYDTTHSYIEYMKENFFSPENGCACGWGEEWQVTRFLTPYTPQQTDITEHPHHWFGFFRHHQSFYDETYCNVVFF